MCEPPRHLGKGRERDRNVSILLHNATAPRDLRLTAEGVPTVRELSRVVQNVRADIKVRRRHIVLVEELVERLGRLK